MLAYTHAKLISNTDTLTSWLETHVGAIQDNNNLRGDSVCIQILLLRNGDEKVHHFSCVSSSKTIPLVRRYPIAPNGSLLQRPVPEYGSHEIR